MSDAGNGSNRPIQKLQSLQSIAGFFKSLWEHIIDNPSMMNILEQSDNKRKMFFELISKGYVSPLKSLKQGA